MYLSHPTGFKRSAFARLASVSVALVLAMSARFALAGPSVTTMATLLDRIQIEDMLVEYYGHLGGGHDFGSFYAPDGHSRRERNQLPRAKSPSKSYTRRSASRAPCLAAPSTCSSPIPELSSMAIPPPLM